MEQTSPYNQVSEMSSSSTQLDDTRDVVAQIPAQANTKGGSKRMLLDNDIETSQPCSKRVKFIGTDGCINTDPCELEDILLKNRENDLLRNELDRLRDEVNKLKEELTRRM
jgi:hypothetical protein